MEPSFEVPTAALLSWDLLSCLGEAVAALHPQPQCQREDGMGQEGWEWLWRRRCPPKSSLGGGDLRGTSPSRGIW